MLLLAALVVACSSGTPAPTGAASSTATQPPTTSLQPQPLPTGSFVLPSFSIPSFAPDTTLEAAFPTEIDGQPVSEVESASFLAVLQAFGTEQTKIDAFIASMQAVGVDPAGVSFGIGSVTLDDETVSIQALRTPGGSASNAIQALIALDPPEIPPTITTETIGGKQVTVATLEDGEEEFYYASGELAWLLNSVDRAHAEVIFAALP
jgi:hypothetical protein